MPEKAINFAVYLDGGQDLLGVAEGALPNLEFMTSEVKGAGIAGTIDSLVLGHLNSITMTLTWRNTTSDFVKLAAHKAHELDLYVAQQDYNAGFGEYDVGSLHVFLKAIPKSAEMDNRKALILPEFSKLYLVTVAARAAHIPAEVLRTLSARDFTVVTNAVQNFLTGSDSEAEGQPSEAQPQTPASGAGQPLSLKK